MATIGHEAPLRDNMNPAGLGSGEPLAPQLKIGQEAPESDPVPEELPPAALQLTEKEQAQVDRRVGQGLDRLTAILQSVPPARARLIVGNAFTTRQAALYREGIEQKKQAIVTPGPSMEELAALLRDTSPRGSDSSIEPTNKAA